MTQNPATTGTVYFEVDVPAVTSTFKINPLSVGSEQTFDAYNKYLEAVSVARTSLHESGIDPFGAEVSKQNDLGKISLQLTAQPVYNISSREQISDKDIDRAIATYKEEKRILSINEIQESRKDHLTGLYNRKAFFSKYPNGLPVDESIIIADLCGLKDVNDNHGGHAKGDQALRSVGVSVHSILDKYGINGEVFRFGGDEFVITIKNGDLTIKQWDEINNDLTQKAELPENVTYLRAGKYVPKEDPKYRTGEKELPSFVDFDSILPVADAVEADIKILTKAWPKNDVNSVYNVPLLATREELQQWMEDKGIRIEKVGNTAMVFWKTKVALINVTRKKKIRQNSR